MSNTITIDRGLSHHYGDVYSLCGLSGEKTQMVVISGPRTFIQRLKLVFKILRGQNE